MATPPRIEVHDARTGEPLEVLNVRVVERAAPATPATLALEPERTPTQALLAGEGRAIGRVALEVIGRAAVAAAGIKLASPRKRTRKVAREALAGSLAVQGLELLTELAANHRRAHRTRRTRR